MNTENIQHKKLLLQSISVILVGLMTIGILVVLIDPYQQYRPSDKYICNQRLEIAGIARNHDYDAFFTGSSMSMNHYPEQVDSLWGWRTRNFSIMGATYEDYEIILPFILAQHKAKNVIVNLDFFSFARHRVAVDKYLYDDNIWNDYEYLYNYTSLKNCIKKLTKPEPLTNLYHFDSSCGIDALSKSYNDAFDQICFEGEIYDYDNMVDRFQRSFLTVVQNYPPPNC